MISTLNIVQHDQCPRLQTWSAGYELPRVSIAEALNTSLREGLLAGDAGRAYASFMAQASNPGLDVEGRNVYDVAQHHARLIEVVCFYLLGDLGAWKPCGAIDDFQPLSYQMEDERLRRVVLCSSWSTLREAEERNSWWTAADTAITNRPMLINAIVIGQSRNGFRLSPWTTGFVHPENGIMRIKKKEGRFTENWRKVYREATDYHPEEWLKVMQGDGAFEDVVHSLTVAPSAILHDLGRIRKEIAKGQTTMRRSHCFRQAVCPMAKLCYHPTLMTPALAGWEQKSQTAMVACV